MEIRKNYTFSLSLENRRLLALAAADAGIPASHWIEQQAREAAQRLAADMNNGATDDSPPRSTSATPHLNATSE